MGLSLITFFIAFLIVLLAYIFYKKKLSVGKNQPALSTKNLPSSDTFQEKENKNSDEIYSNSDEIYSLHHIFTISEIDSISKAVEKFYHQSLEKTPIFPLLQTLSDVLNKVKENKYQIMYWKEEGCTLDFLDEDFSEIESMRLQIIKSIHENDFNKIKELITQIDEKQRIILQKAEEKVLEDRQYHDKLKNWETEKNQLNKLLQSTRTIWEKIRNLPIPNITAMEYDYDSGIQEFKDSEQTIDKIYVSFVLNKEPMTIEKKNLLMVAYQKIEEVSRKFQEIHRKFEEIQHLNDTLKVSLSNLFSQTNEIKKKFRYQNEDFLLRIENIERYYAEAKKCLEIRDLSAVKEFLEKMQYYLQQAIEIGESLSTKIMENREKLEVSKRKTMEEWEIKKIRINAFPKEKRDELSGAIRDVEKLLENAYEAEAKVDLSSFQTADNSLKFAIGKYEKAFQAVKNLIKE